MARGMVLMLLIALAGAQEVKREDEREPKRCVHHCERIFDSLFKECNFKEAEALAFSTNSPCAHFYRYFIQSYFSPIDVEGAVRSLVVSLDSDCEVKDLAHLVYGTKISNRINLLGTAKDSAEHYRKIAEKVYDNFFKAKSTLFSKWEFEHLKREGENSRIIDFVKTLTKGGDAVAAENLLSLIKTGHVDSSLHLDFLKESARSGQPEALGMLGNMYYYGWGVKKSIITARHYFEEGAKKNDPDCLNGLGMIYLAEGSFPEAKKYLEEAGRRGSASADYNLFLAYESMGNFLGEIHLLRSARHEGYLPAVYRHGERAWKRGDYDMASMQFKSIAAYFPKLLEIEALALKQCKANHLAQALYTSILVGDLGPLTGYKNAAFILTKKRPSVESTDRLLFLLNKRLANSGISSAAIALGNAYYYGQGVAKDTRAAFAKYFEASLMKSSEASYLLGWMYEHGEGVEKNLDLALSCYSRMEKRNPSSYILGSILRLRVAAKVYQRKVKQPLLVLLTAFLGAGLAIGARRMYPARKERKASTQEK